jgi:hypothetical protein
MPRKNFKIESSLYPTEYIKSTIEDFSDFSISFTDWSLSISADTTDEIQEIFNEFMNYILWKINETI